MTAEEALNRHFVATGILEEGCTREDWYADHWIWLRLGRVRIPFFPILRRGGPIVLHDLHHMLGGRVIVENGTPKGDPGSGRFIPRSATRRDPALRN